MIKWLHEILNPHCEHCSKERQEKYEREDKLREHIEEREEKNVVCPSCETYKEQLAIANHEKKILLDRLLHIPEPPVDEAPREMSRPNKMIPWRVKQQMLEAEDRKRAQLMKEAPKPIEPDSDLEREVLEAEVARENKHG